MNRYISLITNALFTLNENPIVSKYDVLVHEHTADKFQLKLRIEFTDLSVLYTNEYIGNLVRKYAFQWQTGNTSWLVRWDNVPHFPKLASFPHHKHDYRSGSEVVTDSFDISLAEVLVYIHDQLTNSKI
ncbi:DUF6516 family protein [Spirosoma migulaei]